VGRDASRDKGGEQALWRDLVARLELPSPVDLARAPWPDRENLGPAPAIESLRPTGSTTPGTGPAEPDADNHDYSERNRPVAGRHHSGQPGGGPADMPALPGPGSDAASPSTGDSSIADSSIADSSTGDPSTADSSTVDLSTTDLSTAGAGALAPESVTGGARDESPGTEPPVARPDPSRDYPARRRIIRPASFLRGPEPGDEPTAADSAKFAADNTDAPGAEPSFLDFLDQEDDPREPDNRYVPPPLPPGPKIDPVAKGAWLALFGGPGYLLVATVLGWQMPGWAELLAVVAFVTGFVVLVSRMGDGPSRRDGPDQGAVV